MAKIPIHTHYKERYSKGYNEVYNKKVPNTFISFTKINSKQIIDLNINVKLYNSLGMERK